MPRVEECRRTARVCGLYVAAPSAVIGLPGPHRTDAALAKVGEARLVRVRAGVRVRVRVGGGQG